ncbi:hypothetical protein C7M84_000114 [Penaeus vannamei]|uniref:Reverse transcriptase domain-containing protein n=1 Tax=Penaeus vannamei TaxID=6689 RepID=A0A423TXD7_PENVA|nr:hypothetical protein C7M84_000114 [Penaeus vannamei]
MLWEMWRYGHYSGACTASKDMQVGNEERLDAGANSQPTLIGPTQCNLSPCSRSNGPYKRNRGWEAMSNGHCTPLREPVEVRLGVGGSEKVLPVYVAEMEDPRLLGIDYLMQVGACIDLKKRKLRIQEKEVPLFLGVTPAEVVMAERVCIASDTESKVPHELSEKSIEPLEQVDDSEGDLDLGHPGLVQHYIRTGDAVPIKHAPRRIAQCEERSVMELEAQGVVERSGSPWSSPIVLVTKKDGTKRFCVDYRSLNNVTAKDSYPLPRMDDTLDALAGAHWFSTLDLKSGYHQGLWQFTVMPFGLCNAPSCFERLMERVLEGLQWRTAFVYLDDIIVFGGSFDEGARATGGGASPAEGCQLKAQS